MKTLDDLGDVRGQRVLVRVDFNVPLDGTTITDDTRIRAALPTINKLRDEGAKLVLVSHLGRPKGEVNPEFSLSPVAVRLSELLHTEVKLAPAVVGDEVESLTRHLADGDVLLLENVRFEPGETKNREGRMFPLTPTLRAVLERQRAYTRALERATGQVIPWVFHRQGRPIRHYRRTWLTACRKALVPHRIPHDFRRGSGQPLLQFLFGLDHLKG